jgi:hypothetical protein
MTEICQEQSWPFTCQLAVHLSTIILQTMYSWTEGQVIHCDFPINAHLDAGVFTMNIQETTLVIYSQYFKRTLFSDAESWSTKSKKKTQFKSA